MFTYTPTDTSTLFKVDPTLMTAPSSASAGSASAAAGAMSWLGPSMAILGGIQSAFGAYQSIKSTKSSLEYQSAISSLNAKLAEDTAQSILEAGEREAGRVSLQAGKVKSAQKVSQAARGVVIGAEGAADELATTDLMKEIDMLTINTNAVRQAGAARMQSTNFSNEALTQGASAGSLNPYAAATTSLLTSATDVASSWYRNKKLGQMAAALGVQG